MSDRMLLNYLRPLALLLSASLLMAGLCGCGKDETPDGKDPLNTNPQSSSDEPSRNTADGSDVTPEMTDAQQGDQSTTSGGGVQNGETAETTAAQEDSLVYNLGSDLIVTDIGKYAGIFMEDGSDEVVSDTLMLILRNDNTRDLQLARIELRYADFTAEFEVTNLPAGESVVLLEKNRHAYVEDLPYHWTAENTVFFQEPMGLQEDTLKITGERGKLTVENISDRTLGDIYIYYKNSAVDLLYGGITYRARVDSGMEPGDTESVMTGHYNPETCTIVNVQIGPSVSQ